MQLGIGLGLSLTGTQQRSRASLSLGLASAWLLGEATGAVRKDSYGSNDLANNGSGGGVSQVAGVGGAGFGSAFAAASSQYLAIASNSTLQVAGSSFTFAGWVKLATKPAAARILSKYAVSSGGVTQEYTLGYIGADDRFEFSVTPSGGSVTAVKADAFGSPIAGTWYFVAAWQDAPNSTISISVNNGAANQVTGVGTPAATAERFVMGTLDGVAGAPLVGQYLDGALQNWGFWKRLLTAPERTTLYNGGTPLAGPY